jgi:hypothetical protein
VQEDWLEDRARNKAVRTAREISRFTRPVWQRATRFSRSSQEAIHPREGDDQPALPRCRAARKTRSRAPGEKGNARPVAEPDDRRHLLGRPREHHRVGDGLEGRRPIALVDQNLVRLEEAGGRVEQAKELVAEVLQHGGDRSLHVVPRRGKATNELVAKLQTV